jgi:hypothetical protein
MAKTIEKKKVVRSKTHSSISVSNKIVCEDEACIGKAVDGRYTQTEQEERRNKNKGEKKRPSTSMSIAGEDACSDDACIGRK